MQIGKIYTVYGMQIFNNNLWFYILDEKNFDAPLIAPFPLFKIVDNRLSRYWIFGHQTDPSGTRLYPIWTFPEMTNDVMFYQNLMESYLEEIKIYAKYKKLMDLEFPNPAIEAYAEIGDDKWLICPKCIDAWLWPSDRDALVECPTCNTIYNNPRYVDGPKI